MAHSPALAFPTNHVKKVSNNLYQVIIDTTRLKWFLDKFSIAKLDKIDIKGAPKLYVEIDNTGRLTRLLCQYNYEYYDITLNIYDIMYSADSLQVEQPQGATNLTPLIIDSVTEIE